MSVPPESVVPPPPSEPYGGDIPAEERTWAMMAHLSALLGALVTVTFGHGWACFIGPLVIWLVKKDTMPFVNDQAKEALNFNITVAIATLVLLILSIVTFGIGLIIAIPMWVIIWIAWLVLTVVAGMKANEGVRYRYPFALRLIK
ncbi:DUF4870 domain-containing protein [Dyella sp. 2HG41-7]|uniref:DUF4870 domain-containing protein n=1 Tax=Dyella sp. 2HG41-7 TaxID=2883239 RepID=UPI001F2831D0|nr:DUF4870 domain-containing protein [Dyella sp. 2HG41-7]